MKQGVSKRPNPGAFTCLFYLWLRWVVFTAHGLPLAAASRAAVCHGARLLSEAAPLVAEHGL